MLIILGYIAWSIIPFGIGVLVGMLVGLPSELQEREGSEDGINLL